MIEVRTALNNGSIEEAKNLLEKEINIEITKTKSKKFNIFDFCADYTYRVESMQGVYYDPEGYAVATDGHIMIALKDERATGEIINKRGEIIPGKFPNWQNVIPQTYKDAFNINPEWVKQISGKLKEVRATKDKSRVFVSVNNILLDAKLFQLFLAGASELQATDIRYCEDDTRPILIDNERGKLLLMPMIKGKIEDAIIIELK